MRVKRLSRFPDRPHNAGHFIGDSAGGLIVANTALQLQTPERQPLGIGLALRGHQHGACSMNEQGPQINVTMLADPAKSAPQPAGVFGRSQAEIGGEMAAGWKSRDIAD